MNQWKYKLQNFMYGRNGNDQLNRFLLILSVISLVISMFAPTRVFYYITLALLVLIYYRMFSKNIYKRQSENNRYLSRTQGIRTAISRRTNRFRDKEHKYFSCPSCHQTVRVPRGRGKIEITCPKCRAVFVKKS